MNKKDKYLKPEQLALYMGADVKDYTNKATLVLTPVTLGAIDFERWKVKPYLRPLSDMTENEALGWLHAKYGHWGWQVNLIEIQEKRFMKFRYNSGRGRWSKINSTMLHQTPDCARTVAYLLSCGFDLFDWIEQGLALDKTKKK